MARLKQQAAPPEQAPAKAPHPFLESPLEAAYAMHDKAVLIMDAKWGTDVVQTLVSPELAAKFAGVRLKLEAAREAGDDAEVIRLLGSVVRGLTALDEAATAAGRVPLDPGQHWTSRDKHGNPWLLVQTPDDARAAHRSGKFTGYQIWSFPEFICMALDKSFESVLKAKGLWPEAAVVKVARPAVDWRVGDEVVF